MLRVGDLGRMQPAIDMNDGFLIVRQLARLGFADAAREGQSARDLLIVVELRQVLGRRNERDIPVAALRRFADLHQLDPLARCGELLEIPQRVVVRREIKIVSRLVPQHRFGRRDLRDAQHRG